MEAKIQRHIIESQTKIISEFLKIMRCKHKWEKFGQEGSYWCKKCHYYTAIGSELNKLIKKLLTNKKK